MKISLSVSDRIFNIVLIEREKECLVRFRTDNKVQYIRGKIIEYEYYDNELVIELESEPITKDCNISIVLLRDFKYAKLLKDEKEEK